MTMEKHRIGFIGGNGHHYLTQLLSSGQVSADDCAWAGDGYDDTSARQKAERLGVTNWHDNAEEMLETFSPSVINIGGVYGHNGEWVATAIRHGAHVISDKPIAGNWQQLEAIQQALGKFSEKDQPRLLTELPWRCDAAARAAKQAVASGTLGKIALMTGQKSYRFNNRPAWYANREDYAGTLLWVASHAIDILRYISDCDFTRVSGLQGNVCKPDYGSMEDHTAVLYTMDQGGSALVHADFLRPQAAATHGDDRARLIGEHGVIEIRNGQCLLTTHENPECDLAVEMESLNPGESLWHAALDGDTSLFSTEQSLNFARLLLTSRDALDANQQTEL